VTPSILLVEDEPDLLLALRLLLEDRGHDVVDAATGAEALRLATERRPDVVVLDVGLPDMDGLDVLSELGTWPSGKRPAVVVISAHASGHTAARARELGCEYYMTKPFDPNDLVETIGSVASGRAS
jgi:two-component system KDP operon response regulator KdpE